MSCQCNGINANGLVCLLVCKEIAKKLATYAQIHALNSRFRSLPQARTLL